jgi:hypothetical protein
MAKIRRSFLPSALYPKSVFSENLLPSTLYPKAQAPSKASSGIVFL